MTPYSCPNHYSNGIQPVEIAESWGMLEPACVFNIIKYLNRYSHKGTPIEDIEKAQHYLSILKKEVERKNGKDTSTTP